MNQHIPKQGKISVFLLEDHEIFRRGIRDLLAAEPDIDLVGEAGTASSALARMPARRPDVAILDVRLPDGDGISVCREICSTLPGTACLMLTGYGGDQALLGAILAGAAGYVSKQTCGTDLLSALRTVASGKSILDPHASGQVMARLRERTLGADPVAALTEQEKRVLELIGEGLSNRQIAQRMVLAEKTVKNYVSSVLTKLGMQSRTQAAAFSARHSDDRDEYGELVTVTPDKGAARTSPASPSASDRRRVCRSGTPGWRRDAGAASIRRILCSQRAPAEPPGDSFELVPDHEALVGDGGAVQRHPVRAVPHLDDVERAAKHGLLLDVPQVDDIVEQEHEPFQRLGGNPAAGRLAGGQQGDASRADESDQAAHVGGETIPFTVGEDQFGQAVDADAANRVLGQARTYVVRQDVQVKIAHRDVRDHQMPGI